MGFGFFLLTYMYLLIVSKKCITTSMFIMIRDVWSHLYEWIINELGHLVSHNCFIFYKNRQLCCAQRSVTAIMEYQSNSLKHQIQAVWLSLKDLWVRRRGTYSTCTQVNVMSIFIMCLPWSDAVEILKKIWNY